MGRSPTSHVRVSPAVLRRVRRGARGQALVLWPLESGEDLLLACLPSARVTRRGAVSHPRRLARRTASRQMTDMLVSLETLEAWTVRVLERAGASSEAAVATAKALVDANRRGVDSHGVVQLYFYLPGLRAGTTRGDAEPSIEVDLPAAALVDGHDGLGPYIAGFAMDLCCTKARSAGAAAVGVRNSSHFGASSVYAEQATRKGCFGLVFTNSDPGMSPLGALGPILGTNPITLAAPNGSRPPVSLDIATSVVAQGKVVLAEREGRTIPAGWAIGPGRRGDDRPGCGAGGGHAPHGRPQGIRASGDDRHPVGLPDGKRTESRHLERSGQSGAAAHRASVHRHLG